MKTGIFVCHFILQSSPWYKIGEKYISKMSLEALEKKKNLSSQEMKKGKHSCRPRSLGKISAGAGRRVFLRGGPVPGPRAGKAQACWDEKQQSGDLRWEPRPQE